MSESEEALDGGLKVIETQGIGPDQCLALILPLGQFLGAQLPWILEVKLPMSSPEPSYCGRASQKIGQATFKLFLVSHSIQRHELYLLCPALVLSQLLDFTSSRSWPVVWTSDTPRLDCVWTDM